MYTQGGPITYARVFLSGNSQAERLPKESRTGFEAAARQQCVLTRVAKEGALPAGFVVDAAAHDAWFRAKVQEAVDDPRPAVPHEKVEAHFSKRRAAALLKAGEGKA